MYRYAPWQCFRSSASRRTFILGAAFCVLTLGLVNKTNPYIELRRNDRQNGPIDIQQNGPTNVRNTNDKDVRNTLTSNLNLTAISGFDIQENNDLPYGASMHINLPNKEDGLENDVDALRKFINLSHKTDVFPEGKNESKNSIDNVSDQTKSTPSQDNDHNVNDKKAPIVPEFSDDEPLTPERIMEVYTMPPDSSQLGGNHILKEMFYPSTRRDLNDLVTRQRDLNLNQEFRDRRKPDVILGGIFKSGTTTAAHWIQEHPDIIHSDATTGYYTKDWMYAKGPEWHIDTIESLAKTMKERVIFERCSGCFTRHPARERIKAAYPDDDVKIIFVARDPIDRLVSDYLQNIVLKETMNITFRNSYFFQNGSVNPLVTATQRSIYVRHMVLWLQMFPRPNLLFIDGDSFAKTPWIEMEKIEKFIGVKRFFTKEKFTVNPNNPDFFCIQTLKHPYPLCMGSSKGRRHPTIDADLVNSLKDFFRSYNKQLSVLLNQTFLWNNKYI
ncbi:unnamed protein product [Owenia fusiformis]|uniref:Uncharacterized protein n=1 Tax=Owenia fusiformis TaxID=6347 RepID=A0A8J1TEP9_OWEFU|nr:unnamed protein product [Owenia fusiformis]